MQNLSFKPSEWVLSALPVLPDLEVLDVPGISLLDSSMLYRVLSRTPNLKELALGGEALPGDPVDTIPALSHLDRIVCHTSWLPYLIPRRPITTAEVLCDSRVRVQEVFKILQKGSVSLRDLTLTYEYWSHSAWSPNDLEPVARYLPELEVGT
ncbi:hypothetical protein FS837_001853 [Tulasnella sp. UAMH 9824]|nr:hypothetical protein FS837_001853 [Tulasnella sp. UAMH 9824]